MVCLFISIVLSVGCVNTLNASVCWINHKAGRAEFADGLVLFNVTRSVFRTGGILARIAALVVDAGHVSWATAVSQTDGNRSDAVFDTDADGPMVQHLADFVGRRARIARSSARILAPSSNASQVTSALVVHPAFDRIGSAGHLARLVQHETVLTDADGPVSTDFASFALVASHVLEVARILTGGQVGVAGLVSRTLIVPGTGGHDGRSRRPGTTASDRVPRRCYDGHGPLSCRATSGIGRALVGRPANVALRARTPGLVQDDAAQRVGTAGLSQRTRILTLSLDASLVHRAVVVDGTRSI